MRDVRAVLDELIRAAPGLHKAGTFSTAALQALARHAGASPVARSVETGSGASTLLFSHLSDHHTVFAVDGGTGSIRRIEQSPMLRPGIVTFVEGPSQTTLPAYRFEAPLQLALIDGPHAYPFPDLEYYFIYPHLDAGALLVVDDIHIPTIGNLFEVLRADEMFSLEDVVETTAFFRRTAAPTFPPTGDGWLTQGYNRRAFESAEAIARTGSPCARVDGTPVWYLDSAGGVTDPAPEQVLHLADGAPLELAGWAIDVARRQPAAAIDLVVGDRTWRAAVFGMRPDVAAAHGGQGYLRSGFRTRLPAGAIAPGRTIVELRVVINDGREYQTARRLEIEAS